MNDRTVNQILNTKFKGGNYKDRAWTNTNKLADRLQTKLSSAIASGQAPAKTIRDIRQEFGVNQYKAERLVRTETNYFENRAEVEAAKEMGIEQMQFLATLDGRTSDICQENDGEIIDIDKVSQGTNAPPMHPNCRSSLIPFISKDFEIKTRAARDPETGKNVHIANMSYQEWAIRNDLGTLDVIPESDALMIPKIASDIGLSSQPKIPDGVSQYEKRLRDVYDKLIGIDPPYDIEEMVQKSIWGKHLTKAEINTINDLELLGYKTRPIFNDPNKPTYDLYFQNRPTEIKHIFKNNPLAIANAIYEPLDKGKTNFLFDITYSPLSTTKAIDEAIWLVTEYKNRDKITHLAIKRGMKIIIIK